MIWLGSARGYLTDWLTQLWVRWTGRRLDLTSHPWLSGPVAPTTGISPGFFAELARRESLTLSAPDRSKGVLPSFAVLRGGSFNPDKVDNRVARFYEQTSAYDLDVWAEWCGVFRPFGWLLAVIFSRRLQQLNVPLSALDTCLGVTNEVLQFRDPATAIPRYIAWFRRLNRTGNILYAGFYSVCSLPGKLEPCVKVVFPLPNGNAIVLMRTEVRTDGSFVVTSAGRKFGEPGFYFTVQDGPGAVWARYVCSLRESIHVYGAEGASLRADHILKYFGVTFLRIHYRMTQPARPA